MMHMKRFWNVLPAYLFALLLLGCNVNDDDLNYHFVTLGITEVEVPESFQLNETYEIGVTFLKPNDCTSFEGFDVRTEGGTVRRVVAIGAEFEGQACDGGAEEARASFQFICLYDEPYLFRFYTGNDADGNPQYIEVEVPVN